MSQMPTTVAPPTARRSPVGSPPEAVGGHDRPDARFDAALDRAERRERCSDGARSLDRPARGRDSSDRASRERDRADDAPTGATGVAAGPSEVADEGVTAPPADPGSSTIDADAATSLEAAIAPLDIGVTQRAVPDHLQVPGGPDAEGDLLSTTAAERSVPPDAGAEGATEPTAVDTDPGGAPQAPTGTTAGHPAPGRAAAGRAATDPTDRSGAVSAATVTVPGRAAAATGATAEHAAAPGSAASTPAPLGAVAGSGGITEPAQGASQDASTATGPAAAPGPVAAEHAAAPTHAGSSGERTDPAPGLRAVELAELGDRLGATLRRGERVQTLSIQLHPAELGAIKVEARLVDGVTHVAFTADSSVATERLASTMSDLRHQLTRAGVDVGDLDLSGHGREPGDRGSAVPHGRLLADAARTRTDAASPVESPKPIDHRGGAVAIDL